jgi:hypothetical protein
MSSPVAAGADFKAISRDLARLNAIQKDEVKEKWRRILRRATGGPSGAHAPIKDFDAAMRTMWPQRYVSRALAPDANYIMREVP